MGKQYTDLYFLIKELALGIVVFLHRNRRWSPSSLKQSTALSLVSFYLSATWYMHVDINIYMLLAYFCAHSPISVLCLNNICRLKTILRVNIESAEQNEFCSPSTFFLMLLFSNGWNIRSLKQIRPMISNFVQLEMVQRNAVAIADYIIDRLINWLREPPDKVHFAESF